MGCRIEMEMGMMEGYGDDGRENSIVRAGRVTVMFLLNV